LERKNGAVPIQYGHECKAVVLQSLQEVAHMARQIFTMPRPTRALVGAGCCMAALALAQVVAAQTMGANSAAFNAGFGRSPGEENRPVDVQLSNASGNVVLSNGLIQTNGNGSLFGEVSGAVGGGFSGVGGALDTGSGVSSGSSSSTIGNNLNVVVQGGGGSVIVTPAQTSGASGK